MREKICQNAEVIKHKRIYKYFNIKILEIQSAKIIMVQQRFEIINSALATVKLVIFQF